MDETDYVSLVCDRVALHYKGLRAMSSWYVFQDKRPGSLQENFAADARSFDDYQRIFKP